MKALLSVIPIETLARTLQWRAFPKEIRESANLDTHVVLTNDILKFHTHDARAFYYRQWRDRVATR
jgi:hypothetical protein